MALAFYPNIGFQPVKDDVRVSVLHNDNSFKEGVAGTFNWDDNAPNPIKGWREMQPDEVSHPQHSAKYTYLAQGSRA